MLLSWLLCYILRQHDDQQPLQLPLRTRLQLFPIDHRGDQQWQFLKRIPPFGALLATFL